MDQLVTILGVVVMVVALVFSHRDLEKKFRREISDAEGRLRSDIAEMRKDIRMLTAHVLGGSPELLLPTRKTAR